MLCFYCIILLCLYDDAIIITFLYSIILCLLLIFISNYTLPFLSCCFSIIYYYSQIISQSILYYACNVIVLIVDLCIFLFLHDYSWVIFCYYITILLLLSYYYNVTCLLYVYAPFVALLLHYYYSCIMMLFS